MPWNFPTLCIPMITDKPDSTMEILILHHLTWTVVKIQSKYMEPLMISMTSIICQQTKNYFCFLLALVKLFIFILVSLEYHWTMGMYQFTPCEK